MGLFVISILIGIVGLVFLLGRFKKAPRVGKIVGVIGVVIGGALLVASMFTVVDAGEVGQVRDLVAGDFWHAHILGVSGPNSHVGKPWQLPRHNVSD